MKNNDIVNEIITIINMAHDLTVDAESRLISIESESQILSRTNAKNDTAIALRGLEDLIKSINEVLVL